MENVNTGKQHPQVHSELMSRLHCWNAIKVPVAFTLSKVTYVCDCRQMYSNDYNVVYNPKCMVKDLCCVC